MCPLASKRLALRIEFDNARDGALCGFFSCGSTNRLKGSATRNLDALGVGWEERLCQLCFPNSGVRLLFYFLITVGCLF